MSVFLGLMGLILAGGAGGLLLSAQDVEDDGLPVQPLEGGPPDAKVSEPPNVVEMLYGDEVEPSHPVGPSALELSALKIDGPLPEAGGGDEITSDDSERPDPQGLLQKGSDRPDGLVGGAGHDQLYGARGDDQLVGQDGNDRLYGGAGADRLEGGHGDDSLSGGAGADYLGGGLGNDLLAGEAGDDTLFGGAGNDSLYGGGGLDWLEGGLGDDYLEAGPGGGTLDGGVGNDTLTGSLGGASFLNGQEGDDLITLRAGDIATGGEGADQFVLSDNEGGVPAKVMDYTAGEDRLLLVYDSLEGVPDLTLSEGSLPDEVIVKANGIEIARVVSSSGLALEDITLVPRG